MITFLITISIFGNIKIPKNRINSGSQGYHEMEHTGLEPVFQCQKSA